MIDLHMHTTASDGTLPPESLVARVRGAGITTFAVTDHDTMASVPAATAAAERLGLTCVPGIELTTVEKGQNVHVLGYFLDAGSAPLQALLARVRTLRLERAREIAARLEAAGAPIDIQALVSAAESGPAKSIARPQIARAIVAAGHVVDVPEAFQRYLGEECCAYVPHRGASPAEAIAIVRDAGGIASLAHPGILKRDDLVPALASAGLTALEAHHSAHAPHVVEHYVALARAHGLAVSGGSDFHGDGTRRAEFFGVTCLPAEEYERLAAARG